MYAIHEYNADGSINDSPIATRDTYFDAVIYTLGYRDRDLIILDRAENRWDLCNGKWQLKPVNHRSTP